MIDSHCHLQINNDDFNVILNRAQNSGVRKILNVFDLSKPEDFSKFDEIISLNSKNIEVLVALGVHPLETEKANLQEAKETIEKNIKKIAAIGETGIDLFKAQNYTQQMDFFAMQCDLAKKYNKPIIVHQRNCEIVDILSQIDFFGIKAVFHSWSADSKNLEKALQSNVFISFSGMITFGKVEQIVKSCEICPLNSMLLETDSPFLSPVPFRGKQNEPAHVEKVYEFVSSLKKEQLDHLKTKISTNFQNFIN